MALILLQATAHMPMSAVSGAEGVTAEQFMLHAWSSVLVALFGVVSSVLAFLESRRAKKHANSARSATESMRAESLIYQQKITGMVNGRLDEMLKMARENGYQQGINEGINIERARRSAGQGD